MQENQFSHFYENKMQLEKMEMNAENAYHATHDNSYLDIIKEIKNVITNANLLYETTQLRSQLPGPYQTSSSILQNPHNYPQNFLKYFSDRLTHEFQHIQPQTNVS